MTKRARYAIHLIIVLVLLSSLMVLVYRKRGVRRPAFAPLLVYKIYFPVVFPYTETLIGYQMDNQNSALYASETPASAIILDPIHVYDVVGLDGTYNWTYMDAQQNILSGKYVVYSIKDIPATWRFKVDYECSRPLSQYWEDYAGFLVAFYHRYKSDHNIMAVEIWNEPGAAWQYFDPQGQSSEYYGCWGDTGEPDIGGGRYGDFYEYVKSYANSHGVNIPLLIMAWNGAMTSESFTFLESAMASAGEIDALSFHTYSVYEFPETWSAVSSRYEYLRTITDKPLWLTETALQYSGETPTENFRNRQAEYLDYVFANYTDLQAIIWYSLENSWKWVGMTDGDNRYPVWYKFTMLSELLGWLR